MTDEIVRTKIGIVSNAAYMHIGRRKSEIFFCNSIMISPVGQGAGEGDERVVGYLTGGKKTFELNFRQRMDSVGVGIYPDGSGGTLTLGLRSYEIIPQQGLCLTYDEHELTDFELQRYLAAMLLHSKEATN